MRKKNLFTTAIILCISLFTNAQIIYTDINDGTPTGIDFNQDGTNEFDISDMDASGDYIEYYDYGLDNNIHAIGTINTENWDVPACVNSGFTIDENGNWEGAGDCAINGWGDGNATITPNQNIYLAVRFNLGGTDLFYGWILISVDNSGNVTYKEYAYNSTANAPINAGEIGSPTVLVTSINIQSPNNSTEINTAGGNLQLNTSVLPENANNSSVTWSVVNETGNATISTSGLLTAISDGTVTVTATANDGSDISASILINISNQSLNIIRITNRTKIEIYPNPIKETFRIKSNDNITSIKIFNLLGEQVKSLSISNINESAIDISNLNKGIYLLYIFDNTKEIYSHKLIKE